MTQPTQSRLATQEMDGKSPVIRLRRGMQGEIRVVLAAARFEESENRAKMMRRAPEVQPGQWVMTRLMVEWLVRDDEIDFHDFSRTERGIYNEFGRICSDDFDLAVRRFLELLELAPIEAAA